MDARAVVLRPSDLRWQPHPNLPPGAEIAVLHGDPARAGIFAVRVRSPARLRVAPHAHPEDRVYTVIDGTFAIGFGERFDAGSLAEVPPGGSVFVGAGRPHFQFAPAGGYTIEIVGTGPTATTYARPEDDPRTAAPG
ncbi:MAG TPA: cupin domain-containing protein [Thermoplasmata archaeon]|jgi:mannose-6-phosphate isomerase-like protein (cupin superfamily)|nr:cupin domain-containing protein [Thermoplasmata archaeon]